MAGNNLKKLSERLANLEVRKRDIVQKVENLKSEIESALAEGEPADCIIGKITALEVEAGSLPGAILKIRELIRVARNVELAAETEKSISDFTEATNIVPEKVEIVAAALDKYARFVESLPGCAAPYFHEVKLPGTMPLLKLGDALRQAVTSAREDRLSSIRISSARRIEYPESEEKLIHTGRPVPTRDF